MDRDQPTRPAAVPEGRDVTLSRESAQAIAAASVAAGFDPPAQLLDLLAAPAAPPPATDAPPADREPETDR